MQQVQVSLTELLQVCDSGGDEVEFTLMIQQTDIVQISSTGVEVMFVQ